MIGLSLELARRIHGHRLTGFVYAQACHLIGFTLEHARRIHGDRLAGFVYAQACHMIVWRLAHVVVEKSPRPQAMCTSIGYLIHVIHA